jgi:diacylglycerol kinase family enzyme
MRKVGLIINPYAKKSRRVSGLTESLTHHFPNQESVWVPKNLDELSEITKKILEDKVEVLFLSGGDGTFRATAQSLLNHKSLHTLPIFVPLQGGTGCLYSKHYYGTRNPILHMKQGLKKLQGTNKLSVTSINILNVNGTNGFIFALGGFSNLISYYMSHKERSLALANWLILSLSFSFLFRTSFYKKTFPTFSVQIKDNTTSRSMDITTLSCSSIPVGYILQPFHGIKLNQFFAGIIFSKSPFRIFRHLKSLILKRPMHTPDIESFYSSSVQFFLSHPLQPMVDGDMLDPTTEININLGPQINLLNL